MDKAQLGAELMAELITACKTHLPFDRAQRKRLYLSFISSFQEHDLAEALGESMGLDETFDGLYAEMFLSEGE